MHSRDPWGGPFEIDSAGGVSATDDDRSRNLQDLDRAALSRQLDATQQSWLLSGAGDGNNKRKRYVDLGCFVVSRKIFFWTVGILLGFGLLIGFILLIIKVVPHRRPKPPPPDQYTLALHKALMFFNAQRSGPIPKHSNNVTWRGSSGMRDGLSDDSVRKNLVGGYYDAGDAIKFNFPMSFAMTMLSWSVVEYRDKYDSAGELQHVRDIIKWGTDYLLKTFNSSADTIDRIVAQVFTVAETLSEQPATNKF